MEYLKSEKKDSPRRVVPAACVAITSIGVFCDDRYGSYEGNTKLMQAKEKLLKKIKGSEKFIMS